MPGHRKINKHEQYHHLPFLLLKVKRNKNISHTKLESELVLGMIYLDQRSIDNERNEER